MEFSCTSAMNGCADKTYSLFLICNPQWFPSRWDNKDTQIYKLYEQFDSFGFAIGDENAAVWFWKKDSKS